ncbi:MAG: thioredoxin family protein [Deltaproteobacteria bacterium]|nr:thioredoxin family protein [Deltaproteobacteria bacterium]
MDTDEHRWGRQGWLLVAFAMTAWITACRKQAPQARWEWQSGGLAEVLAAARAQGAMALVEVYASWCPTCHELEQEVFSDNAARVPADRIVGVRVDFDTPAGQEVATNYRVMGLPTSLVLDASGKEISRIEGYETVDGWLASLEQALAGKDDYAAVLARYEAKPDDAELAAEAGAVKLARGEEEEGIRILEEVRAKAGAPPKAVFAATRTLGRWFFRVRHQYDRALAYFQDGVARAGDDNAAWGFQWWTAMSLKELGRPDEALALFERLMGEHPGMAQPVGLMAEYLYTIGGDDVRAIELARRAAELGPTDDWNHYLVAVLAERMGDATAALDAVRRALELKPGEAIYAHLMERLQNPAPAP